MRIPAALLAPLALGAALSACATTGTASGGPAEVLRYHLGEPLGRGTVVVQPADGGDGLSAQPFAAAVARAIGTVGYALAPPGGDVQYIAVVDVRRRPVAARPRRSGFSIGIGAGGFSGGRRGGVGLGGGVAIPVGGARSDVAADTELSVTIKRRVDLSPVWEGHARAVADRGAPTDTVAEKLARALFTGFPGESGRTIEVR